MTLTQPSISSLSRYQFNQLGSANGKIAPAMLLLLTVKQTLPTYFSSHVHCKIAMYKKTFCAWNSNSLHAEIKSHRKVHM